MSQVTNLSNLTNPSKASTANAINDVDLDDFLKLMISELQNQDPLNPLENDQLLAQISQIREVGATEKLTSTLDAVLLGQNITSATSLIGAEIEAISDDNQRVSGLVNRITISNGQPKLHLEEGSKVAISDEPGDLESGQYSYRIVWENEDGILFGVETDAPVDVTEDEQSIQISNLPVTDRAKQVYRTKSGGNGPYYFVGSLADGKTSSYLDTTKDDALSGTTLTRTPQLIDQPNRSFEVSLNNVGEIRPPR
ncbi:flagellar hook assembly protein FlgD [Bythopirellula polymerisocia]|uniref:Basal-body rod modification protein FlgD n=1 Tax=Bythopirellula polymerisocia TaxID=2528003 RepID=A0A5C6CVF1_9BACT|nr:flagellar hook capping FlgD N-terminal domain-containing protein [Bythopirellula polymerisocia]TWU27805.1 Basal-body rod modification protein FlgD [Bythopirellula polymerisocia]